jgi:glycine cleavage system H protein
MDVPSDRFYTKTHEWAKRGAQDVVVGITSHAQEELRDVVFVELPKVGRAVKRGEAAAVIESVKAAFDIYAPVSGTIARVNDAIAKSPQLVNQDCYEQGWLFAVTPAAPEEFSGLLSSEEYAKQIHSGAH